MASISSFIWSSFHTSRPEVLTNVTCARKRTFKGPNGSHPGQRLAAGYARRFGFLLEEAPYGFRRLGAAIQPIVHSLAVHHQLGGISAWVIVSQDLHRPPVARPLPFDHHDSVAALFLGSCASQSDSQQSSPLELKFPAITEALRRQPSVVSSQNLKLDINHATWPIFREAVPFAFRVGELRKWVRNGFGPGRDRLFSISRWLRSWRK